MSLNHLIDLADMDREEVRALVGLAGWLRENPQPQALAGKILGLVFFNPSLRTLASTQAGMARLGGTSFVITPGQGTWQLESRLGVRMDGACAEHVREGLPVLASFCDVLGIRSFAAGVDLERDLADGDFRTMASVIPSPLVNLESAIAHPMQGLADWRTLDDLGLAPGSRFVLSWVTHPRALPLAVPATTVHMAALRGHEVVVLRPEGYALPAEVMDRARAAAALSGGSVTETSDRQAALAGASVVYAKEWGSPLHYGQPAVEAALRATLNDWQVDESWFAGARADCRFMHCLPVRRNVAVSDAVLDGSRSVVLAEANNRLWTQMAVLYRLLRG
jgi:N-acetylornithine carbamoyltransferase